MFKKFKKFGKQNKKNKENTNQPQAIPPPNTKQKVVDNNSKQTFEPPGTSFNPPGTNRITSKEIDNLDEKDIDDVLNEVEQQHKLHNNNNNKDNGNKDVNWKEIFEQIKLKNMNYIKNLITSKEIDINEQNPSDGRSLLHYAVIIGDIDLVTAIFNFGAKPDIADKDNLDALSYAIKYGRYKITELVYYRTLSGSLGNDMKDISTAIFTKNKQAQYIYETSKTFPNELLKVMIKAISERAPFDESMLYFAWYFSLKECETNKTNLLDHKLWKAMIKAYEEILSNTSDKPGWSWLKSQFVNSLIWYLPHPNNINNKQNQEEKYDDDNDNDNESDKMEKVLKTTLFYELLVRIRKENKKQSDKLLREKIDQIKNEKPSEWNQLVSYNVHTKYSKTARQDECKCLLSKYKEEELSQDIYPPSVHFNAKKHYDSAIYLNQLLFRANILDDLFQKDMRKITKEINKQTGQKVIFRAGPVKTHSRSTAKVENDYINEAYPTSAKILDINRCALQFQSISQMMQYLAILADKISKKSAGCISEIIRCKNGWSVYDEQYPQYTDIKLNVLIQSNKNGIIAEIQFLLNLMSSFKKKAHKLYSVERKFEMVYNFALLKQEMRKFKDVQNAFNGLAMNDDIKYFALLWQSNTPNKSLLVNMDKECDILDDPLANILISPSTQIHNYLKEQYKSLYIESILYYFNQHKVVKDWDLFLNGLTSTEKNETKKSEIQFEFIKKLIDLFAMDSNYNSQVQNLKDATKILSQFGAILCLLNTNPSLYYNYKATNNKALTFKTPKYLSIDGYYDHKQTKFKLKDDSLSAKSLYIFGRDNSIFRGFLGLGEGNKNCLSPRLLEPFKGNVLQVATAQEHNLVLDVNGNVWVWGDWQWNAKAYIPKMLPPISQSKVVRICAGGNHSAVITEDGRVYAFGRNHEGQLGHGDLDLNHDDPELVEPLKDIEIVDMSAAMWHSAYISSDGKLFTCGQNEMSDKITGQLGLGKDTEPKVATPTEVNLNGLKAAKVACGYQHTLIVATNGLVLSCGEGPHGALGHGPGTKTLYEPKVIDSLKSKRVVDAACGDYHSLVVTENGQVYGFGLGSDGQLANITGIQYTPIKLTFFAENNIKIQACYCGCSYSAVISDENELFMFGNNENYQLGQGKQDKQNKFKPISLPTFDNKCVAQVGLGEAHSCVVTMDKFSVNDDNKENEQKEDASAVYLGIDQQKEIVSNKLSNDSKQVYGIYVQNEKLFGHTDWNFITQFSVDQTLTDK